MENIKYSQQVTGRINEIIKSFLDSQLGEKAKNIQTFLNDDIVVVYAHDILSPAEKQLVPSESENKMLMEYKVEQFESVKPELINEVAEKTGLIIKNANTIVTKDGIRIINITIENQN